MKLKTLKDLKHYKRKGLINGINELELKAEAIKWVNVYKDFDKKYPWRDIFMKFHNITEEDLK